MPSIPKWGFPILAYCLCPPLAALSSPESTTESPPLYWNRVFTAEMKRDTLAPAVIARNLAALHSGMESAYTSRPECPAPPIHLLAYKICSLLLPNHTEPFDRRLDEVSSGPFSNPDREFADSCLAIALKTVAGDGATSHVTYMAQNIPGAWCRTAPFFRAPELPHWPRVRPRFLKSASQFRPQGPPDLTSARYSKAVQEVQEMGSLHSSARTPDQTQAAQFWSDFSYTETPVGHWNSIARGIVAQQNFSNKQAAHLFFLLNASLSDTAIACWDAKFSYNFWRPITAIQRAESDGNPDTLADPSWTPLLNTPNHPEYVSGHSAFSGAASHILSQFLGTDKFNFEVTSDTLPNVRRTFHSFDACALECGESRIYGGIHYRFSCEDGTKLGKQVAGWILDEINSK